MSEDLNQITETSKQAALEASKIIINLFNKAAVSEKGVGNLVTEADIAAEKKIREIILKTFPEHSILGEEAGGEDNMESSNLWIIDPLDGTNNYAHGLPIFSVSIAYAEYGKIKSGIVYDPTRDELFSAIYGKGAFLNGKPISVSENPLTSALVSVGFYYNQGGMMQTTLKTIDSLFAKNIHGVRRTGSAAIDICYVAAGRLDAYIEYRICPWDFAAGMLILREAGGVCMDAFGNALDLNAKNIAVSNGVCTDDFIKTVKLPFKA